MKTIDLTQIVYGSEGEVYKQRYTKGEGDNIERYELDVTLGQAIKDCVVLQPSLFGSYTETEVISRYNIFKKVDKAESAEFSDDELQTIKSLILIRYLPMISAQYLLILNK